MSFSKHVAQAYTFRENSYAISYHLLSPLKGVLHGFGGDIEAFGEFVHVARILDVIADNGRGNDLTGSNALDFIGPF